MYDSHPHPSHPSISSKYLLEWDTTEAADKTEPTIKTAVTGCESLGGDGDTFPPEE